MVDADPWTTRVAAAVAVASRAVPVTPLTPVLELPRDHGRARPDESRRADPRAAFRAARRLLLAGERIEMGALAAELGVDRATVFRWVGNRDQLVADVIWSVHAPTWEASVAGGSRAAAEGGVVGVERVAEVLTRWVHAVVGAEFFREYLRRDRDRALRLLTTSATAHQARIIGCLEGLLVAEQEASGLELPLPARDHAYVLTRVAEAFVYADLVVGEEPDADRAAAALAVVVGASPVSARTLRS